METRTERINFSDETEAALNGYLNFLIFLQLQLLALAAYLKRSNVAFLGTAEFVMRLHQKVTANTLKISNLINENGGKVIFDPKIERIDAEYEFTEKGLLFILETLSNLFRNEFEKLDEVYNSLDRNNEKTPRLAINSLIEENQRLRYKIAIFEQRFNLAGSGLGEIQIDNELALVRTA